VIPALVDDDVQAVEPPAQPVRLAKLDRQPSALRVFGLASAAAPRDAVQLAALLGTAETALRIAEPADPGPPGPHPPVAQPPNLEVLLRLDELDRRRGRLLELRAGLERCLVDLEPRGIAELADHGRALPCLVVEVGIGPAVCRLV